jgi:hypothetical protein
MGYGVLLKNYIKGYEPLHKRAEQGAAAHSAQAK